MRFARFLLCISPLLSSPSLSLSGHIKCVLCVLCVFCVCVFHFSLLFFTVNFAVEFCMLHSRTESFLVLHLISILALSLILFCFAFADCFVFEKWLSHHFHCIFECLSLSLSPCVCVGCLSQRFMRCNLHTLTKNSERKREKRREREGGSRRKNKAKRLFHAYIEWKAEKPPLVGKWQR